MDCLFFAGLISSSDEDDSALTFLRLAGAGVVAFSFFGAGLAFFAAGTGLGLVIGGLDSGSGSEADEASISIGFYSLAIL
jgi:hypothetical protein